MAGMEKVIFQVDEYQPTAIKRQKKVSSQGLVNLEKRSFRDHQ